MVWPQHPHSGWIDFVQCQPATHQGRRCCSTLALLRAFVNKPASLNSVGQYWSLTVSSSPCSRTKWYFTSMCFVRFCITGFSHILIQLWLSSLMTVGPSIITPISSRSDRRYRASWYQPHWSPAPDLCSPSDNEEPSLQPPSPTLPDSPGNERVAWE